MVHDYSQVPAKVTLSGFKNVTSIVLFNSNLVTIIDDSLIINVETSNELAYYTLLANRLNASISSEAIVESEDEEVSTASEIPEVLSDDNDTDTSKDDSVEQVSDNTNDNEDITTEEPAEGSSTEEPSDNK